MSVALTATFIILLLIFFFLFSSPSSSLSPSIAPLSWSSSLSSREMNETSRGHSRQLDGIIPSRGSVLIPSGGLVGGWPVIFFQNIVMIGCVSGWQTTWGAGDDPRRGGRATARAAHPREPHRSLLIACRVISSKAHQRMLWKFAIYDVVLYTNNRVHTIFEKWYV